MANLAISVKPEGLVVDSWHAATTQPRKRQGQKDVARDHTAEVTVGYEKTTQNIDESGLVWLGKAGQGLGWPALGRTGSKLLCCYRTQGVAIRS